NTPNNHHTQVQNPSYGSNTQTQHVHLSIAHTRTAERDLKNWITSSNTTTKKPAATKPVAKPKPTASKTKGIVYTNRRNAQIYKGTGKNAKLDPVQPVAQNYK